MEEKFSRQKLAELLAEVSRRSYLPPNASELAPLREMLGELDKGLPRATSREVLGAPCIW